MILFQSHTDNNRVHVIRLELQYDPVTNEHTVRARLPNQKLRNQDEWTIQVPSELRWYIQKHMQEAQQVGIATLSISSTHAHAQHLSRVTGYTL